MTRPTDIEIITLLREAAKIIDGSDRASEAIGASCAVVAAALAVASNEDSRTLDDGTIFVRAKCDKCERFANFALPDHVAAAWKRDADRRRSNSAQEG
jgi:hypothetical protein